MFSLVNSNNVPIKLNKTSVESAIYASVFNGPSFGEGNDLYTVSDENQMMGYSYLGNSYQKPKYLDSFSTNSFLTGTNANFEVFELEVYSINRKLIYN